MHACVHTYILPFYVRSFVRIVEESLVDFSDSKNIFIQLHSKQKPRTQTQAHTHLNDYYILVCFLKTFCLRYFWKSIQHLYSYIRHTHTHTHTLLCIFTFNSLIPIIMHIFHFHAMHYSINYHYETSKE